VTWFDNFSILLRRDGQSQLVYMRAICTIMPGQPLAARAAASMAVGPGACKVQLSAAGRVPGQRCAMRGRAGDDVPGQRRDAAGPGGRLMICSACCWNAKATCSLPTSTRSRRSSRPAAVDLSGERAGEHPGP